jgi:mannosylglucosylglycerate synthase
VRYTSEYATEFNLSQKGADLKRIAILHYAGPPTIGGVESTIAHHAKALAKLGYSVRIVSGTPSTGDNGKSQHGIEMWVNPLFSSTAPDVLNVKRVLDHGDVTDGFHQLVGRITKELTAALADCDICIAHNVLTLNKNLPLTAALRSLVDGRKIELIAWCHDLAWANEQYLPELHNGYPWNLLRNMWPDTRYVTVSEPRCEELAVLLDIPMSAIQTIVPGIDPAAFFQWTPVMQRLENQLHLLDSDGLLLIPARITRRKNIALGLHVLSELRSQSGKDFRLIVTGPPGPHNPTNPGYLGELLDSSTRLNLESFAHFLYAYGTSESPLILDDLTMANLYQLADMLFFPTLQEGFGIPILEAGLVGLPIFCADIPALRHSGRGDANYFDPLTDSPATIASRILAYMESNATSRLRRRVRQTYRWDIIVRDSVVPLLE